MPVRVIKIVVIVLLLISAGFFGWLFLREFNQTVDDLNVSIVGEMVEISGQVQRRQQSQSFWHNLKDMDELYTKDSIRTLKNSSATIILQSTDQNESDIPETITLGADTHIILDLLGENREINFLGGKIFTSSSKALAIVTDDAVVNAEGVSVNLSRQEGEELSIAVTEGEAQVLYGGEETTLDSESTLKIDEKTREQEKIALPVVALTPKANAKLLSYKPTRRVEFSWELLAGWQDTYLETSTDPLFSENSVQRFPADQELSLQLSSGEWYWRISDQETEEHGLVSSFTVDQEILTNLISPAADSIISFFGDSAEVSMQWSRPIFANSYVMELAPDQNFTRGIITREVRGSSVLVDGLEEGDWWWRVIPQYHSGVFDQKIEPEIRSFRLQKRLERSPLRLIAPGNSKKLSAISVRDGIDFRWQTQNDIDSYHIIIASDADMNQILSDSLSIGNTITLLAEQEPGTYYWRVEADSSNDLPVPPSEIRSFDIMPFTSRVELISPESGEAKELDSSSSYNFIWRSGIPGTARFMLQRIERGRRTLISETQVEGTSVNVFLPDAGNYVWRVQILNPSGTVAMESTESNFSVFNILTPPQLISPRPGEKLSLEEAQNLILSWIPSAGADAYKMLVRDSSGTVLTENNRITGVQQKLSLSDAGEYSVDLSAVRNNPQSGVSGSSRVAQFSFTVEDATPQYVAAVLQSPANNSVFNVIDTMQKGILFRWTQNPDLVRRTVALNDGRITRLYRSNSNSLRIENIDAGSYSWTVLSEDALGREAPESASRRFTVRDLPAPASPEIIFPSEGEQVNMTEAQNLTFIWKDLPQVDFYDLKFYSQGASTPLLQQTVKGSRYIVNDLSIFDVGDFVIEMIAIKRYPEFDKALQSRAVRRSFSLSLDAIKNAPKILTDELQYVE